MFFPSNNLSKLYPVKTKKKPEYILIIQDNTLLFRILLL